jgi:type VI secretion system protein ImpE
MTPHEALADGRLSEAIALQTAAVDAAAKDSAARRFLIDLLAFAGRFAEAREQLAAIDFPEPEWAEVERDLLRLLRSEQRRSTGGRKPQILPEPPAKHASRRWMAVQAIRQGRPEDAVRCIDAADATTPELHGFINGQEFDGLRDADDRYASILEAFRGGEYVWYAWEALRKVELAPALVVLDQLYRPATITLKDGARAAVHLPLVYPGSCRADDVFALGLETDHVCPDAGPTRCVGAKVLLVNDADEAPLKECRMIEIR